MSFTIIGGNPFRTYTGALTFTHLSVQKVCETKEEATEALKEIFEECYGLVIVINEKGEDVTSTL